MIYFKTSVSPNICCRNNKMNFKDGKKIQPLKIRCSYYHLPAKQIFFLNVAIKTCIHETDYLIYCECDNVKSSDMHSSCHFAYYHIFVKSAH